MSKFCGKVLKKGDTAYSCKDCATHKSHMFCAECFENSAHKKHAFQKLASVKGFCDCGFVDRWSKNPNCDLHVIRQDSQICGKFFKPGETTYYCTDCAGKGTRLCGDCYQNSVHKKHNVQQKTSSGGGYCDCGIVAHWNKYPNCELHKLPEGGKNGLPNAMSRMSVKDAKLPSVFISYQWDIQDKVKQLKKAIEAEGIPCWMDIGQMGGGDELFAKIDAGISAAKIIISCVTHKYAASENCKKELSLAGDRKKKVIPILFESMDWPPKGSMSMMFTGLLYVNFTSGPGVIPRDKFKELMSKIKG